MAALPAFSSTHTAVAGTSRRLVRRLPEWTQLGQLAAGFLDIGALSLEVVGDCAAQAGIGDVVRGVGGVRQISARELVLALRAGFDDFQLTRDREIDGLIVADLEMQERMMLERAPVAAEQSIRAEEGDGAGDPRAV